MRNSGRSTFKSRKGFNLIGVVSDTHFTFLFPLSSFSHSLFFLFLSASSVWGHILNLVLQPYHRWCFPPNEWDLERHRLPLYFPVRLAAMREKEMECMVAINQRRLVAQNLLI